MSGAGVVFVHGLFSSRTVWESFENLILQDPDLSRLELLNFEYRSPKVRLNPARRIPDFDDLGDSLATFIRIDAAHLSNVALVSHSQGGLVVQRYLARTLTAGRGLELERIRQVVMFACPNDGSEFALSLRRVVQSWLRSPQERDLAPLTIAVTEARSTVLNRIVHAQGRSAHEYPIAIHVYAGDADNIVKPQSAHSVFPQAGTLPGDHGSIIRPDGPRHRSFTTLRRHLLDLSEPGASNDRSAEPGAQRPEVDAAQHALKPAITRLVLLDERVALHYRDGCLRYVAQPELAALVVRLALAVDMRVSTAELKADLWPDATADAMAKAVEYLRRRFDLVVEEGQNGGAYQLKLARTQVDALRFVDSVLALPNDPVPAEIDRLLALWSFDPRGIHAVRGDLWNPVFDAVGTLAEYIMAPGFTVGELANLARFKEVLRAEPPVRALPSAERRRRRLLIVDDDISAAFRLHLGDFEFEPIITTIEEFWDLTTKNPVLDGYDCALVDQHLTGLMNDYNGVSVCEYLRDRTTVPTILMSAAKLPARGPHDALKRRLRLVGLYTKADDGTLEGLRDMIEAALDGRPV